MIQPLPVLQPLSTCTLCPLHHVAKHVGISLHILPHSLPPSKSTPAVLVIGQNPGYNEDVQGTPFIGKSGTLLQRVYLDGISLHTLATIYITNTARCYHRDGAGPTNRHYTACRPYLLTDILHLHPLHSELILLTLGGPAATHTYHILGHPKKNLTTAMKSQGTRLPLPMPAVVKERVETQVKASGPKDSPNGETYDTTPSGREGEPTALVFSTFHPAAVLRTHNLIYAVQGHLQTLLDHLTHQAPIPSTPRIIHPRNPR